MYENHPQTHEADIINRTWYKLLSLKQEDPEDLESLMSELSFVSELAEVNLRYGEFEWEIQKILSDLYLAVSHASLLLVGSVPH